jgi:hypothetical protein
MWTAGGSIRVATVVARMTNGNPRRDIDDEDVLLTVLLLRRGSHRDRRAVVAL